MRKKVSLFFTQVLSFNRKLRTKKSFENPSTIFAKHLSFNGFGNSKTLKTRLVINSQLKELKVEAIKRIQTDTWNTKNSLQYCWSMKTSKPKQIRNLNKAIYYQLVLLTEETTKPRSTKIYIRRFTI
jgi:hypothetical protein